MNVKIFPSSVNGTLVVPPSKSVMQRICALALMNKGRTVVSDFGKSEDELTAINVIQQCGALVIEDGRQLIIESTGIIQPVSHIDFGESGLSSRMFTPLLASTSNLIRLNASGSLLRRNMDSLIAALQQAGVAVTHHGARFPLTIQGPLKAASLDLDCSSSSQHVTGFLFAMCFLAVEPLVLKLDAPVSKPYIDLSIEWLKRFGYKVERNESLSTILISPNEKAERKLHVIVESDWSSASFLIAAALLAGNLQLKGLEANSKQADSRMLDVLDIINADYFFHEDTLSVKKMEKLTPFSFDATDCPDLFPVLAVLAAYAEGLSVIKGAGRLANKESDRGKAIQQELGKLGVSVELPGDEMHVHGKGVLNGGVVAGHDDHRIVMAMAIAALRASDAVIVEGTTAVNKSFPDFFLMLTKINAQLNYLEQ